MKLLHLRNMKLVIFDFDGTIADTSPGILDSHRFALNAMGRKIPSEDELRKVIGGNLLKVYINTFGFSEAGAREAVRVYRERYAEVGVHKATLYSGFEDTLKLLKERGYKIGIATLKAESFAKTMVQEMKIAEYFDAICGMDPNDGLDKAELILKCCNLCNCEKEYAVLIGDSDNDWLGSKQAKVKFIGATYGFGFKPDYEYEFVTVDEPFEILQKLGEEE